MSRAESNLDDFTDAEVYVAIRYLEPQVRAPKDDAVATVIGVTVFALAVAWLGFIWFCPL